MTSSAGDLPPLREQRRFGRRAFVGIVATGVSSLYWGPTLSKLASPAAGLIPAPLRNVLPTGGWRIYTVTPQLPTFDAATWSLGVGGLVERKVTFTYPQLLTLPRVEQVSDFHCVTGWSVKSVHWAGVRLGDVLGTARPLPTTKAIAFLSADGAYVDMLTPGQAALRDVLLAYEMDGRPLTREHGAPLRLVIPEMYGYKGVKWVNGIVLVDQPFAGYWEQRGYDVDAWVGRSNQGAA
jgi:DMSO/TMAO reductase YedYZ molybdopterin-dependent catalytic subunit